MNLLLLNAHLQLFCEKLDVTDLEDVVPTLQRLTMTADAYPHLEQVCCRHSCNMHSLCDVTMWICVSEVFFHIVFVCGIFRLNFPHEHLKHRYSTLCFANIFVNHLLARKCSTKYDLIAVPKTFP